MGLNTGGETVATPPANYLRVQRWVVMFGNGKESLYVVFSARLVF